MRRKTPIVFLAAAMIAITAGCGGSPDVKLGAVLSMEGIGADYGPQIKNGIDLAVEEINGAGGISVEGGAEKPIRLLFRDARSDPETGVRVARELVDEGVSAVVGAAISDVSLSMAPIFQDAGVIMVSPASSSPRLGAIGDYIYRIYPSDEVEGLNIAGHIYNHAGLRDVVIVAAETEWAIGIRNTFIQRFRMLGGSELDTVTFSPGVADFASLVQGIADLVRAAPAVFIAAYTADTARIVQALRDSGSESRLFATSAILSEQLVARAGDAAEGLVFPLPEFDPNSDDEHVEAFVSAYRDTYGEEPNAFAAHGYDSVKLLAHAIERAGDNPDELRFYLNTMNPYQGVAGAVDFDEQGDARKFHTFFRIQDGQAVPVETDGGDGGEGDGGEGEGGEE
ncbi:MAG: ABC transporter substrate-binding protein [Acidobacteriota bacterium]